MFGVFIKSIFFCQNRETSKARDKNNAIKGPATRDPEKNPRPETMREPLRRFTSEPGFDTNSYIDRLVSFNNN